MKLAELAWNQCSARAPDHATVRDRFLQLDDTLSESFGGLCSVKVAPRALTGRGKLVFVTFTDGSLIVLFGEKLADTVKIYVAEDVPGLLQGVTEGAEDGYVDKRLLQLLRVLEEEAEADDADT